MSDITIGVNKNEKAKEMGYRKKHARQKKEKRGNRFGIRDLYIRYLGFCGEYR